MTPMNGWCRGRLLNRSHLQWYSDTERATYHGVGVLNVRHITATAYERATHYGVGVRETSKRSRTTARSGVSMQNVVRDNYAMGMSISCDLHCKVYMKYTRLLISWDGRVN